MLSRTQTSISFSQSIWYTYLRHCLYTSHVKLYPTNNYKIAIMWPCDHTLMHWISNGNLRPKSQEFNLFVKWKTSALVIHVHTREHALQCLISHEGNANTRNNLEILRGDASIEATKTFLLKDFADSPSYSRFMGRCCPSCSL